MKKFAGYGLRVLFFASFALLPAICSLFPSEAAGADWKIIENDDEGPWFYDAETVECFPGHRIQVRTRKIYERKAVLAAVDKYGKSFEGLDYVLAEWEIDCFQRKFKLHSAVFHSKENAVIERYQADKEGASEEISPDSYLELLRKKVCK